MNGIFNAIPLPQGITAREYDCGNGAHMLLYTDVSKAVYDEICSVLESRGFSLYDSNNIENNFHRTYLSDISVHIYYCESEKSLRIIADRTFVKYPTAPSSNSDKATLWQFEVDHSLIDCGMCYIVRTASGRFFVIDSAHPYSVNDDIRICEFLKKMSGGRKPVVEGWFISHGHDDHICKLTDILRYRMSEIEIRAVYYNLPALDHRDCGYWGEPCINFMRDFENELAKRPEIKRVKLHTGQRFFIDNLEFTVLGTHEDVFPNVVSDFNNTTISVMMKVGNSKVFFPGDSSAENDKVFIRRYTDTLRCDVMQMSHHGHSGTSPEFYKRANAECVLFPITQIKFDEELPRQESNRVAIALAKEYYIASNGATEIPLPYVYGNTKVLPDETFEDFNGIFNLWTFEYTDERKEQLYKEFLERKG